MTPRRRWPDGTIRGAGAEPSLTTRHTYDGTKVVHSPTGPVTEEGRERDHQFTGKAQVSVAVK